MNHKCQFQEVCSGCDILHLSIEQQKEYKTQLLGETLRGHSLVFPQIDFISVGDFANRDRLDFSYSEGKLGLYTKFQNPTTRKELIDITECPQLSINLQNALTDFRGILAKHPWPLTKASIRIRCGYSGQKGLWIDAANIEIKKLLDDGRTLEALIISGFDIEIGQKGKSLSTTKPFKLTDPKPQQWFSTTLSDKQVPLNCLISSFTQPSMRSNQLTASIVSQLLKNLKPKTAIEFGAGIGNLSLMGLPHAEKWIACEYEGQAIASFKKTTEELQLSNKLEFLLGDFQNKKHELPQFDFALVNPPRSGLGKFTEVLNTQLPKHILYMSCFAESMAEDILKMKHNYSIKQISILDQFVNSKHYEVLTLLQLQ